MAGERRRGTNQQCAADDDDAGDVDASRPGQVTQSVAPDGTHAVRTTLSGVAEHRSHDRLRRRPGGR